MVRVQLFAGVAEAVGSPAVELKGPLTVGEIKDRLLDLYPGRGLEGQLPHCFGAVNRRYCHDDVLVTGADEVALIPPVSGG